MPIQLSVDCRLIEAGGIGTYLKNLLPVLSQAFPSLRLLAHEEHFPLLKSFSRQLIPFQAKIYSLAEQRGYLKTIPPCDLFFSPHFNIPFFPIKARKRLVTIHDVYHLAHWNSLSLPQKIYAKWAYNAAFALSDHVVTVSTFSKDEILKYASIKPKKMTVVPNSFHFEKTTEVKQKGDFILTVGNLKAHKNLTRLVQAYAQVRPQDKLYIVGRKEGLRSIDKKLFYLVENDPYLKHHVFFTDYLSDERVKELYGEAKLFVFPSLYEGFGYPPLEAMACNCPVVASCRGAIPEVCERAVEYVDPYSVDSIAWGIGHVLNNAQRREELIKKGQELLEKRKEKDNQMVELIHACCSDP